MHVLEGSMEANFGGNLNLMLAVTEFPVKRLILMGSMDEYEEATDSPSPPSPYAASKMVSSAYAKMFHNLYDLPIVIAKIYMTYGPNQKDGDKLIPYTIASLLNGKVPTFSSGERMVDWIYVSDVVDGLLKIMITPGLEGNTHLPLTLRLAINQAIQLMLECSRKLSVISH